LNYTDDTVKIGDSEGDLLLVNDDGSINVVAAKGKEAWAYDSKTLAKDTPQTVVSITGAKNAIGILVSGEGKCIWTVKKGVTNSEVAIASFWTTPSDTSRQFTFPSKIEVATGSSLIIVGENKSTAVSPTSDFAGYATIIYEV
jgi:hypothetical protein